MNSQVIWARGDLADSWIVFGEIYPLDSDMFTRSQTDRSTWKVNCFSRDVRKKFNSSTVTSSHFRAAHYIILPPARRIRRVCGSSSACSLRLKLTWKKIHSTQFFLSPDSVKVHLNGLKGWKICPWNEISNQHHRVSDRFVILPLLRLDCVSIFTLLWLKIDASQGQVVGLAVSRIKVLIKCF